jgi:uncharacterized protein with von Willebrand factor type A (vWA) domain
MSWQAINDILGKALLDQRFAKMLLADPLHAVQEGGFNLTPEELDFFLQVHVENITDLSKILLTQFKNNQK